VTNSLLIWYKISKLCNICRSHRSFIYI